MITLAVIVIMWIVAVGILVGHKVNQPPPEDPFDIPPGAYILDNPETGYSYMFEDYDDKGTCYRSRSAAIRAARIEYHNRLKKGHNA